MKTAILISAIVASAMSAPITFAQQKPASAGAAMKMDMEKQMGQMQEKMNAMQVQMDTIRQTTDPKERQKLMQAHMLAMQDNMKAMRGMGGPMIKGSGERPGMKMDGKQGSMKDGEMRQHHAMMEQRMDMMQVMMEQMMQRDHMMQSMPSR